MAGNSSGYHEPVELLSEETKDMHRALVTLMEELEAIDWYQQRAEACTDDALRDILLHNKKEEMEHAMMSMEWIRRQDADFDEMTRTYIFAEGPITEVEKKETSGNGGHGGHHKAGAHDGGSLGIGSLKRRG